MLRFDLHIAKCRRSSTHLFTNESPAPDRVLIRVEHKMDRLGWFSKDSRSVASKSACSFESAGAASAAESCDRGSTEALFVAILQAVER